MPGGAVENPSVNCTQQPPSEARRRSEKPALCIVIRLSDEAPALARRLHAIGLRRRGARVVVVDGASHIIAHDRLRGPSRAARPTCAIAPAASADERRRRRLPGRGVALPVTPPTPRCPTTPTRWSSAWQPGRGPETRFDVRIDSP